MNFGNPNSSLRFLGTILAPGLFTALPARNRSIGVSLRAPR
jgi:hypothetical protein